MASKYVLPLDTTNTQVNPSTQESILLLRRIVKLLESNAVTDSSQRQRVIVDAGTWTTALSAGTANIGQTVIQFGGPGAAAANICDGRYFQVDVARNTYANGLRSKLTW